MIRKKRRSKGSGSASIYWRTITKNGKDYFQAYYHWKENGQKKTKYIPKHLLKVVQEAEAAKRPVLEVLTLLGVGISPSKNGVLGDIDVNPSKIQSLPLFDPSEASVLEDIEINPNRESSTNVDPSKDELLGFISISPSKIESRDRR